MGLCHSNSRSYVEHPTHKQKCKVFGCSESHRQHYCSNCNDQDSNHFPKDCPFNNNQRNSSKFYFKVQECTENHKNHYCKKCGNNDSDHFSSSCPVNKNSITATPIIDGNIKKNQNVHCKVPGCLENHRIHYCKSCKTDDSDHFSSSCPFNNQNSIRFSSCPVKSFSAAESHENKGKTKNFRCKVSDCTENHQVHYCKNCKSEDSDHFSSSCPFNNQNSHIQSQNINFTRKTSQNQTHCKVQGCKEKHTAHYCKSCKNQDSDHFSSDCIPTNKKVNCKVKGCSHNHEFHFCRFCENQDSNHFAIDCPQSIILHHATKVDYLEMDNGIREIGLIPSGQGTTRFGKGIYFAEEKYVKDIKENLHGNEGVILKCRVWLGNCKDFGTAVDYNGNWASEGYDSCTAIHPPWFSGTTSVNFQEYVVKNPRKVRIYNLNYKGKEFRMYDYKKDKEILESIRKGII